MKHTKKRTVRQYVNILEDAEINDDLESNKDFYVLPIQIQGVYTVLTKPIVISISFLKEYEQ